MLRSRLLLPSDAPGQQDAADLADRLRDDLLTLQAAQALARWLEDRPQLEFDATKPSPSTPCSGATQHACGWRFAGITLCYVEKPSTLARTSDARAKPGVSDARRGRALPLPKLFLKAAPERPLQITRRLVRLADPVGNEA